MLVEEGSLQSRLGAEEACRGTLLGGRGIETLSRDHARYRGPRWPSRLLAGRPIGVVGSTPAGTGRTTVRQLRWCKGSIELCDGSDGGSSPPRG